ncbi:ABC transporter ATP-binding protein [Rhizobium sp. SSA_523]|uniref:ABC transporter ATP-binding protein n=1 Tax=Rhizobium sp. SSA_523 TaxID=2952477 RepID=UPI0020915190|nr:ABC transporter ATP-binding protein [Rhizobium sp. SSA_523]MCO5730230.1 ABC transporter ATP-binding protein [Rhizobium sp. SSA_523]WKC25288.1 ABC transporter ATP-binding protein [Rhizobium sp. SSA_523]
MAQLMLNHLSKDFHTGRPAVDGVSMTIREGGFLALLGPSGCGKTTVLRMIAGFERPTGGEIYLGEWRLADVNGMVAPEKRNMAMVFQSYALWPHMSVAENVGYPLKVRGLGRAERDRRTAEALSAVRLEAYADRRPAELSGGQRQRVALARCLVTEPSVVLLDEPLANLDRHLRQEMEETFRDFHARSGATMIYVTHDQAEAMALSTDVAVMAEGRLLQMAAPEEIYQRPNGRTVGALIGQGAILSLAWPQTDQRLADWSLLRERFDRGAAGSANALDLLADVLVRPQDVVISDEGLDAQVESAIFEGERHALKLRLSDGQRLRAFSRRPLRQGDRVRVVIRSAWRL